MPWKNGNKREYQGRPSKSDSLKRNSFLPVTFRRKPAWKPYDPRSFFPEILERKQRERERGRADKGSRPDVTPSKVYRARNGSTERAPGAYFFGSFFLLFLPAILLRAKRSPNLPPVLTFWHAMSIFGHRGTLEEAAAEYEFWVADNRTVVFKDRRGTEADNGSSRKGTRTFFPFPRSREIKKLPLCFCTKDRRRIAQRTKETILGRIR